MDGNSKVKELGNISSESLTIGDIEVEWFKKNIDSLFQGDRKIVGHEVEVKFFNSKHRSAEDIRNLKNHFQNADIYIPEIFGWMSEYLDDLRKLSNGEASVEDMLSEWGTRSESNYARDKEFFEIINNSKKAITIIDVPGKHQLVDRADSNSLPKIKFGTDFNESLESSREYFKNLAAIEKERGVYMLEHFEAKIQELISTNPELAGKEKLNILIDLGAANTLLYHNMKKEFETSREFSATPMAFLYREEIMRRYIFDKPVDDDLLARSVTEYLLSIANKKRYSTSFSLKDVNSIRNLVSKFSFDEMRNVFNDSQNMGEWTDRFYNKIREKRKAAAINN